MHTTNVKNQSQDLAMTGFDIRNIVGIMLLSDENVSSDSV